MLTNEILDRCFLVLGSAVDADAAVEEIAEIFYQNKIETSDSFGYLLQNASTFFERSKSDKELDLERLIEEVNSKIKEIDDKVGLLRSNGQGALDQYVEIRQGLVGQKKELNQKDDEEQEERAAEFDSYKKNTQKTRNEAVAKFLKLKNSAKYFNQNRSQPLLALMLSNSMFWSVDVVLGVIKISDNLRYKIETKDGKGLSYVEYLLSQRSFGRDTPQVQAVVVELLRGGCDFDVGSDLNWSNLLHSRSVESGLLEALCLNFIKERSDFSPFFNLIERLDEKANSLVSSNISRVSAVASRGPGSAIPNPASEFELLAKRIIDDCVKNKELWSEQQKVSLPRFVLARSNGAVGKPCEFSKRLWTYVQARENLQKIFPEIFIYDPQFLHEIVSTNNAALLSIAIESIGRLDQDVANKIYDTKDSNNDTAFLRACRLGHDYAIDALFEIAATRKGEDVDEIALAWNIVIDKGFAKSAALLVKKAQEFGMKINHGANIDALLKKGGHETVAKILGELKIDGGGDQVLSGELLERHPELIHKIIATNNAQLILRAIEAASQLPLERRGEVFNFTDKNGDTPFLYACRRGFDDAIEPLFAMADIDAVEDGLKICAELGFADSINTIMKKVRKAKMQVDLSPALLLAIFGNKETAASNLIANGADVNAYAYYAKVENRKIKPLVLTPLEAAITADNKILVLELLKNGARYLQEDGVRYLDLYSSYREFNQAQISDLDAVEKFWEDKRRFNTLIDEAENSVVYKKNDLFDVARQLNSEIYSDAERALKIKAGIEAAVLFAKTIDRQVKAGGGVFEIGELDLQAIKSGDVQKIDEIKGRIDAMGKRDTSRVVNPASYGQVVAGNYLGHLAR